MDTSPISRGVGNMAAFDKSRVGKGSFINEGGRRATAGDLSPSFFDAAGGATRSLKLAPEPT